MVTFKTNSVLEKATGGRANREQQGTLFSRQIGHRSFQPICPVVLRHTAVENAIVLLEVWGHVTVSSLWSLKGMTQSVLTP